jgi:acetyltransferase-like isoleucine patch superfamily enzyme
MASSTRFPGWLRPQWLSSALFALRARSLVGMKTEVPFSKRIRIGRGTVVKSFVVIATEGGSVTIGRDCSLNNFTKLATGAMDIRIGDYVRMGPGVCILGLPHRTCQADGEPRGVAIGNDALVGAGATILGCTIGEGAIVGAGSVVREDVPPFSIVVGDPMKVVGSRE